VLLNNASYTVYTSSPAKSWFALQRVSVFDRAGLLWLLFMQIIDALFEKDPNGACLAFYDMMKKQILMPAHMMDDGEHQQKTGRNLFAVSA
jgi:hypothetical protein